MIDIKKLKFEDIIFWGFLLFITGIATYLRFKHTGLYYFNPDEAWNLTIATQKTVGDVIKFNNYDNAHPPLFFIFLHFILKISDNITFLRSITLIPGILIVPFIFLFAYRFVGKPAAVVLSIVFTYMFSIQIVSGILRQYTIYVFLLVGCFWFLLNYLENYERKNLYGYLILLFFAVETHHSAAMIMVAAGIPIFISLIRENKKDLSVFIIGSLIIGGAFILNYIYQIWLGAYGPYDHKVTQGWQGAGFPKDIKGFWNNFQSIITAFFSPTNLFAKVSILLFLPLGLYKLLKTRKWQILSILFILTVLAIFSSFILKVYPFYGSRYTLYFLPVMAIIIGEGFCLFYKGIEITTDKIISNIQARRFVINSINIFAVITLCFFANKKFAQVNYHRDKASSSCEFSITKNDYFKVMQMLDSVASSDDIVISEKQAMWYILYNLGKDREIQKISPIAAKLRYHDKDIYYWDQLGVLQITMVSSDNIKNLLKDIKPYINRKVKKVWFMGIGCGSSISHNLYHNSFIDIQNKVVDVYANPRNRDISIYSVKWADFAKAAGY